MADPTSCTNRDHSSLVATVGEQTRLIGQLLAKIQVLEGKLEAAQEAARNPIVTQNPYVQASNFSTSGTEGHTDQQDYSSSPSYGAKKTQAQGQLCNYGSKCIREQCWYEHPGSRAAGNSKTTTSTASQPIINQRTSNSTKRIKQECKFGTNCTRKQCWFEHPSDWVSPNSTAPEPQYQQEVNTEAPVAEASAGEAGNWGANEDSSSWNATPSSGWDNQIDNTWGPPAQADNGWGNSTDTSWNAHPDNQHKPPVNNSRSTSISMSREGSVSNSSANKSQGRGRKARGKGRMADSESIATESTPMSPSPLATTSMSADIEPLPVQTSLSPPAESIDQAASYDEANTLDEMGTPPLEPSIPSLSSEPEAPATPKASWSDEPAIDVVYFPDPPPNLDESQSSAHQDEDVGPSEDSLAQFGEAPADLDQSAPSDLYSSWGVAGPSASDWGLDPTEFPDPTPTPQNKTSGKKSKSKGKQRESSQNDISAGRGTPSNSSNFTAQSETTNTPPPVNESNEPEPTPKPTPEPPQGVPKDEIPDWLLGGDEDAHAALGIPRSVSPSPGTFNAPPRLASTNPTPRTPLSKLAGENFPTLNVILSASKLAKSKDDTPPKPAFSPRPVGWKIIPNAPDTSNKSGKGNKSNSGSIKK